MVENEAMKVIESVNAEESMKLEQAGDKQTDSSVNSELDQLRHIVFGSAKAGIEADIEALRNEMKMNFEQADNSLKQQMSEMQNELKENVDALDARITLVDSYHEDKNTQLNTYADKLASELEMSDANNQQQDDEIKKELENKIEELTHKFTKQHNQTIDLLNQVKNDLNTSKTDRKTLAKLLATVASNLETDEF